MRPPPGCRRSSSSSKASDQWIELPLWLVDPDAEYADRVDVSRALAEGLTFRPLDDTVRATLELADTVDGVGLTPEREAELLAEWHGRE